MGAIRDSAIANADFGRNIVVSFIKQARIVLINASIEVCGVFYRTWIVKKLAMPIGLHAAQVPLNEGIKCIAFYKTRIHDKVGLGGERSPEIKMNVRLYRMRLLNVRRNAIRHISSARQAGPIKGRRPFQGRLAYINAAAIPQPLPLHRETVAAFRVKPVKQSSSAAQSP